MDKVFKKVFFILLYAMLPLLIAVVWTTPGAGVEKQVIATGVIVVFGIIETILSKAIDEDIN